MDTAKIRIHHAVFCHNAHTLGGQGLFNLLQVQHRFTYGPDREFPMRAGPRDLYLRFFVDRPGQMAISVRLWWLSDDRVNKEFVGECGAKAITFSPEIGVQDISIKIRDLVFLGMRIVGRC